MCLLGVVSNIWPKAIDSLMEMTIRKLSDLRDFHSGLEWCKNFCQQYMDKLAAEFFEEYTVCVLFGG